MIFMTNVLNTYTGTSLVPLPISAVPGLVSDDCKSLFIVDPSWLNNKDGAMLCV